MSGVRRGALGTWGGEGRADDPPHDHISSSSGILPKILRPKNRKRQSSSSLQDQVPYKKSKPSGTLCGPPNFPSEFYDDLSALWLTVRALREFDRRNENISLQERTADRICTDDLTLATMKPSPDLARFARTGGPDLNDLRGVCIPISLNRWLVVD